MNAVEERIDSAGGVEGGCLCFVAVSLSRKGGGGGEGRGVVALHFVVLSPNVICFNNAIE